MGQRVLNHWGKKTNTAETWRHQIQTLYGYFVLEQWRVERTQDHQWCKQKVSWVPVSLFLFKSVFEDKRSCWSVSWRNTIVCAFYTSDCISKTFQKEFQRLANAPFRPSHQVFWVLLLLLWLQKVRYLHSQQLQILLQSRVKLGKQS